ncbi:transcription factor bHLH154-like isoform X3 [Olea europaea var. sylvestris]|uniref:transcription factor bHLH154-like isoform X3 n=1 Tax=Olea europaea var. sylvestris TaxID=158386 RepID=UPI000C1D139D|nr:transcription factor bHLH154-like isoform X3 [Olea europaea var. sylvestris]
MMMENKRRPVSLDQSRLMGLTQKRPKIEVPLSAKEKKEKVSERISALQQLVSPYGKTDTASVLLEAMEYIRFLQEQVKVLSAPYLYSTPTTSTQSSRLTLKAKAYVSCQFRLLMELPVAMAPIFGLR